MYKKILVPLDGSIHAAQALRAASQIASEFGSKLILLHVAEVNPLSLVMDEPAFGVPTFLEKVLEGVEKEGKSLLEKSKKTAAGIDCSTRFEIGKPAPVICKVAEEEKCDLIVMGHRGKSDLSGFLLGSTSHAVLERSHCHVLLVK